MSAINPGERSKQAKAKINEMDFKNESFKYCV